MFRCYRTISVLGRRYARNLFASSVKPHPGNICLRVSHPIKLQLCSLHSSKRLSSNIKIEPRMMITFTCNVCNERSTKTFSRDSYYNGMVIITCPSCQSHHLIANNMHKFNDLGLGNIEEFLKEKGEKVQRGLQFVDDKVKDEHDENCSDRCGHVTHQFPSPDKDSL